MWLPRHSLLLRPCASRVITTVPRSARHLVILYSAKSNGARRRQQMAGSFRFGFLFALPSAGALAFLAAERTLRKSAGFRKESLFEAEVGVFDLKTEPLVYCVSTRSAYMESSGATSAEHHQPLPSAALGNTSANTLQPIKQHTPRHTPQATRHTPHTTRHGNRLRHRHRRGAPP